MKCNSFLRRKKVSVSQSEIKFSFTLIPKSVLSTGWLPGSINIFISFWFLQILMQCEFQCWSNHPQILTLNPTLSWTSRVKLLEYYSPSQYYRVRCIPGHSSCFCCFLACIPEFHLWMLLTRILLLFQLQFLWSMWVWDHSLQDKTKNSYHYKFSVLKGKAINHLITSM